LAGRADAGGNPPAYATRAGGHQENRLDPQEAAAGFNRLSAQGGVDVVNARAPDEVMAAFETFLALERASWKGAGARRCCAMPTMPPSSADCMANLSRRVTPRWRCCASDGIGDRGAGRDV